MPDITMCQSVCPRSKECYRHQDSGTKPTGHWQSWFSPIYTGNDCEAFWPASRGTTTGQLSCEHCSIMQKIRHGEVSASMSGIEWHPKCTCKLPESRGTTTGQLVAMHLEAEDQHAPVVGPLSDTEQDHV